MSYAAATSGRPCVNVTGGAEMPSFCVYFLDVSCGTTKGYKRRPSVTPEARRRDVSCGRGQTFQGERQKADPCRSSRETSRHVFPDTCHSQQTGCWCFFFVCFFCVVCVCTLLCCVFSLAGQKSTHNSVCSLREYLSVFVHTEAEGCLLLIEAFSFPR